MADKQPDHPAGFEVLNSAHMNKGTAFTVEEREKYKLTGLLPPGVSQPEVQFERVLMNMRRKYYDIERYIFLMDLQRRNERLFYQIVIKYIEEVMPLIYTPTVGQACLEFGHLFRRPRGMYLSLNEKGRIKEVMQNWPFKDIHAIVVTDGERILGLGDLGANGMGIPIGKLALYVACAGVHPDTCLPVMLDVGTNNKKLLDDELYLGVHQERVSGDEYFEFVDEFIQATQELFPRVMIQFEDFLTPRAYGLLNKYRKKILCFNDDIQGTAGVALAGIYASTRISGIPFKELRFMFLGAGSAATGIGDLICYALQKEGLTGKEARQRLWFVDVEGLLYKGREGCAEHTQPYLQDVGAMSFSKAMDQQKPQVLIGATAHGGAFTQQVIEQMSRINERPTIFALSNPTDHAECTAEQAYTWSEGRAIFSSGSPFAPVEYKDKTFTPGQGNNAYVFPGVGLAAVACRAKHITEDMFLAAAKELAMLVEEEDLQSGSIYPPLTEIRELSLHIATLVAENIYDNGLAREPRPDSIEKMIRDYMYDPSY